MSLKTPVKYPESTSSELKVEPTKPGNSLIYGATLFSILISLGLMLFGRNSRLSIFTGLWAPTILGLGIYLKENKLLELEQKRHSLHSV